MNELLIDLFFMPGAASSWEIVYNYIQLRQWGPQSSNISTTLNLSEMQILELFSRQIASESALSSPPSVEGSSHICTRVWACTHSHMWIIWGLWSTQKTDSSLRPHTDFPGDPWQVQQTKCLCPPKFLCWHPSPHVMELDVVGPLGVLRSWRGSPHRWS